MLCHRHSWKIAHHSSLVLSLVFFLFIRTSFAAQVVQTEILWDTWGVPHIFTKDTVTLFYAFGWAQMKSHGNLILRLYGEARGKAAEYWGAKYLESDRWIRTVGIPSRAQIWYEAQNPTFRSYLDAFADGMNDYADRHGDQIGSDVKVVLPVDGMDVLAHAQRAIHFNFVTNEWRIAKETDEWPKQGSNAWAIGPVRSASGHAMLFANPHLPWSGFYLFYEAQLVAPGINAYGATLVGLPVLTIAFNDRLGWTHTVNAQDGQDLFELRLSNGGYLWNGNVRAFEVEEESIKIKPLFPFLPFRKEKLVIRRSTHGPVIKEKNGKAIALRIVGLDRPGMLEQWWDMGRSSSLGEFEGAMRRMQIPIFSVLYTDHEGHILHFFGGLTPIRPSGDWNWKGIVPGDTSQTFWTSTHPYEDLPRVLDPPSGWLQNANDPPWTTTFPMPLDPQKFPAYMAPHSMSLRAQHSAQTLMEDESISFDELVQYKFSTRLELADRILDELLPLARNSNRTMLNRAADILESWDRGTDANSRGAVLFAEFVRLLKSKSTGPCGLFSTCWREDSPLSTPDGLGDPGTALEALETAARRVDTQFGALDVPWGDVYRFRRSDMDLPATGGPQFLDVFSMVDFEMDQDGRFRAASGDSFIAAVEFSKPVRAGVLTVYGNASQPVFPHSLNQLELYAQKKMRPAWRNRSEIEAHLALHETI